MESDEIFYSLEKRKNKAKEALNQINNFNYEKIQKLENLDNTNEAILIAKLRLKKTNELLFKSFDVLKREELEEFIHVKKLNSRESYFYFLNYIIKVNILEENESKTIDENSESNNNKEKKEPILIIDFSKAQVKFEKVFNINSNNKIKSSIFNDVKNKNCEINFEINIKIKNINIKDYFNLGENISIKKLREKIKKFYDIISDMDEHKNNMPDFQSELYFNYQLKNIFEDFYELNDMEFKDKINMIKELQRIIKRVEKNKINDITVLFYFYFIFQVENELNNSFIMKLKNYDEKDIIDNKDTVYSKEENKLIITKNDKSQIIIENADYYDLNEDDINDIKEGNMTAPLPESCWSIKGLILLRECSRKIGNLIYEKFLTSNVLKEIIYNLYGIKDDIFSKKSVIQTFQENTFYFPIKYGKYAAFTDKNCFKIFIDNKIKKDLEIKAISKPIKKFIQKGFMIINILHEFGHSHSAFLYFINSDYAEFDSPISKVILNEKESIELEEGGKVFEYILFGREIKEINLKEAIYINNMKNFNKNIKGYREDFMKLKHETLISVFEREKNDNEEITTIYEIYKNLTKDEQNELEILKFKSGKINENIIIDYENMKFSSGSLGSSHRKILKDKKISHFNIK